MVLGTTERRASPLWALRLVTLLLSWAWAIIAVGVGLNALIKSNQQQTALRKQVPAGTTHSSDIFKAGVIVTTVAACIAVITTVLVLGLLRPALFTRSFFRTRSAGVKAFINGQQLPASIVQSVERALGTAGEVRLGAILPWFTILFSAIALRLPLNLAARVLVMELWRRRALLLGARRRSLKLQFLS